MAYAALSSLARTLTTLDIREITQFELAELDSLQSTLRQLGHRRYRGIDRSEINELEAKIRDAAWKLQDVIELYQISQGLDDEDVEQEIDSFFQTTEKLREDYEKALENSWFVEEDIVDDGAIQNNSNTVGYSSDLCKEVITELLDDDFENKMYAFGGMAGIGKSHLARDIYHHPLIVQRFDLRLWVCIGSKHRDIENIFVDILAQIEQKPRDLFEGKNEDELKYLLGNSLLGRRYLVAFDDVWSVVVLRDLLKALPYYQNGSSILITTRFFYIAEVCDRKRILQVPLLSNEESWDLLSQNVFAEKPFPTQLEKAGRKIAEICEGLPLLILTVADILRSLDQTEECWKKVAEKKTTTFPDAYDRIYKVLVSSYDYLPQQSKACYLYIAVFRQSQEITLSKLIEMWFVEDLDENENDTFIVFFSSSLAIPCKRSFQNRIQSFKLHSVYWYVCVTEARKNGLFHVLIKLTDASIERPRRLSVQNNMLFGVKEVYDSMAAATSFTRSLLFTGEDHPYPVPVCFNTMLLLNVLAALAIRFYEFPNEVLNLLQLRYIALTHNGELPSSISKLQRLQILILRRHHNIKLVQRDSTTCLPNEIWDLEELLHLRIMGSHLPDPDPSRDIKLLGLSILHVNADSCTEGVFRSLPHLNKLAIEIELQPEGGAESLRCMELTWLLDKLHSLKCVVVNPRLSSQVVAPPNHLSNLPTSLVKLSLNGLGYPWKYMSTIGSLPHLEELKLRCYAFRGPEWEIKDGQFGSLKYLLLEDTDLMYWTAEDDHFPCLRHLIVRHCYKLRQIPCFSKMERVELDDCPADMHIERAKVDNFSVLIKESWNF